MACPGLYCGRTILESFENATVVQSFSDCGACPRGYRVDKDFICQMCVNSLSNYDWIYLGFMILILPMFIHSFCIDNFAYMRRFPKAELILHFCAFVEVLLAGVLTVLLTEPTWSFSINSCGVQRLSDWYTLFFNPSPRYESKSLHCTQEAVYPLQTMVLVFYLLCTLLMVVLRPTLNSRYLPGSGKMAVYYALYIFPILSLLHVCFGGLIYFAFPYLSIIISVVTNAIHFSLKLDQGMKALFLSCGQFRNMIIILGQWFLLAYGIISISIPHHIALLCLVPVPALFYILTAKYTCPDNFNS